MRFTEELELEKTTVTVGRSLSGPDHE